MLFANLFAKQYLIQKHTRAWRAGTYNFDESAHPERGNRQIFERILLFGAIFEIKVMS